MRDALYHLDKTDFVTLQGQIRESLVSAILAGQLPKGAPVPSTRQLAKRLNVSRNTVTLAYQSLAADGYLLARERSGYFVSPELEHHECLTGAAERGASDQSVDWDKALRIKPASQTNIEKPANWHEFPYPFIYGQSDGALFPIADWRECTRQAMSRRWLDAWTDDRLTADDPMLVEQIRQRLLPRRGIHAGPDEILITLGAQNGLYLLANLLLDPSTTIGVEDPGYPDARNIFSHQTDKIKPLSVDESGLIVDDQMDGCDVVYVTPSHQYPTNATMTLERRQALLAWAEQSGSLIIEDDYEFETNYIAEPTAALKAIDKNNRVVYIGSLSKSLVPGLRVGFLIAPPRLIREARALRRLILRHPPGNNQRVVALFLALGYHDTLIGRLHRTYRARWSEMEKALQTFFPGWAKSPGFGGTSYWVEGPDWLDSDRLAKKAMDYGVILEPGSIYFADPKGRANYFRLGFSSIPTERIAPGIEALSRATNDLRADTETAGT